MKFEKYVGIVKGAKDLKIIMDIFLNGLKEVVGADVKMYEPKSFTAMVKKALMVEGE